ncbi:MAG: hypothetical protein QXX95_00845 [Nitrososphaerales archaeon]
MVVESEEEIISNFKEALNITKICLLNNKKEMMKNFRKGEKLKDLLKSLVERSKKHRVWFKVSKVSKGIAELSLRLQVKFKAKGFLSAILKVIRELILILNPIYRFFLKGKALAYVYSEIAYKWGNKQAINWRYDDNYAIYLGFMSSNKAFI